MDNSKTWAYLAIGAGALYAYSKFKQNPVAGADNLKAATRKGIGQAFENIDMNPFLRSHLAHKVSEFAEQKIDDKMKIKDVTPSEVKQQWEKKNNT